MSRETDRSFCCLFSRWERVLADCGYEGIEYRALLGPPRALIGVSPTETLNPQNCGRLTDHGCGEAGAAYRALSGSPGMQMGVPPAWSLCQQACSQTVAGKGLMPSKRPFQALLGHRKGNHLPSQDAVLLNQVFRSILQKKVICLSFHRILIIFYIDIYVFNYFNITRFICAFKYNRFRTGSHCSDKHS